jgi:hypothetical protein
VVTDIPFLIVPGMIFVGVGGLGLLVINIKVSHRLLCIYYEILLGFPIEEQTTQWPKEKGQTTRKRTNNQKKDKQPEKGQTTIYKTYTSKDRVIGTPIKSHNKCIISGD